jgi:hypothetical protein
MGDGNPCGAIAQIALLRKDANGFCCRVNVNRPTSSVSVAWGRDQSTKAQPFAHEAGCRLQEIQMNEQIRKAIRQRAGRAVSKDDLVRAVFDSFRSQQVDLRKVTLEEMKSALVEAARAAREHSPVAA